MDVEDARPIEVIVEMIEEREGIESVGDVDILKEGSGDTLHNKGSSRCRLSLGRCHCELSKFHS